MEILHDAAMHKRKKDKFSSLHRALIWQKYQDAELFRESQPWYVTILCQVIYGFDYYTSVIKQ